MDWANEDYKRMYCRDTADLLAVGPEGRAVWWELVRKSDKSGVIDHGGDLDVLPELLRVPHEWWEVAYPRLVKRGMVRDTGSSLYIPNHEAAQQTPKSDKQRQREARQRRAQEQADVTKRDAMSQNVTPGSRDVTPGGENVTRCHSTQRNATQRNADTLAQPPAERETGKAPSSSATPSRSEVTRAELEEVYQLYPRKQGKAKGLAKAKQLIRTRSDFETFKRCVAWMSEQWRGADTGFCPHFSTFVNAQSWLDDEWPRPSSQERPTQSYRQEVML